MSAKHAHRGSERLLVETDVRDVGSADAERRALLGVRKTGTQEDDQPAFVLAGLDQLRDRGVRMLAALVFSAVGHDDEDRLAIAVALVEAVDATADRIVERGHGAGLKILLGNPGDIGQDTRTNHVDRLGVEDRQFEIGHLEIARLGFLVLPDEIILNRRAIAGGKVPKKCVTMCGKTQQNQC